MLSVIDFTELFSQIDLFFAVQSFPFSSCKHDVIIIIIIIIIIIVFTYLTSKIYNSAVNRKKLLIKFDEKEYWCEQLNIPNISYKP